MVSSYFKNLIANHIWHTPAESALPEKYYLALSTTEPLEDGTGTTEPDPSSGYTRIELTGLSDAVNGAVRNADSLSWAELTTDQGVVGYWAMFDAETGGNLLMGNAMGTKHLDAGTAIKINPSKLSLNVLGA